METSTVAAGDERGRRSDKLLEVLTAVRNGDFSARLPSTWSGTDGKIADTLNEIIELMQESTTEIERVSRVVGKEGKLSQRAKLPAARGRWKTRVEAINSLIDDLVRPTKEMARVIGAVARGDLSQTVALEEEGQPLRGEFLRTAKMVNAMVKQLDAFAAEVTRVAREVGTEGKLGGQAVVPGVAGVWKDLTDNVNVMAANLTAQVRGIVKVVTAVANGSLKEKLTVEAKGEVAALADTINNMTDTLAIFAEQVTTVAREVGVEGRLGGQANVPGVAGIWKDLTDNVNLLAANLTTQVRAIADVATAVTQGDLTRSIQVQARGEVAELKDNINAMIRNLRATTEQNNEQDWLKTNLAKFTRIMQGQREELQAQQRELQQTDEELARKAQQLAEQNAELERKNREIEQARHALEEKAAELALASKYKSEFLANMSHELRTPLNSILILAQQLAENPDGNLSRRQVEFARNIHDAGVDLLNLISDILDLSKIESGTVTLEPEEVLLARVREAVERSFRHVAEAKHLGFEIEIDPALATIHTDVKRLQQVLKNLLSNAFKFTMQGRVTFRVREASAGWSPDHPILSSAQRVIAFEVSDTGIGIPPDKQRIIFEAFHQADAGTSRRFGGTGLGLAISRELATLLGGEIRLESVPGHGSTFTLYLPQRYLGSLRTAAEAAAAERRPAPLIVQQADKPEEIPDDRESIGPDDPVVLIVEDDPHFARVMLGLVREKGFKGVVTAYGAQVRALAREYRPVAITLDIFLPDMLGWTVLSHLKQDPATRHVPVQIITVEEERLHGLGHGAFSCLTKPATVDALKAAVERVLEYARSRRRRLLIVEDDPLARQSIAELLGHPSVEIVTAGSGAEAWKALAGERFDCVVLDLRLPDVSGFELLERLRREERLRELPIVVFTGRELSEEDELRLMRMAESVVLKGVQSPERLLDETSLFLHIVAAELPAAKQQMLERLRQSDEALRNKKVLVVDDDVRNIFALASLLEQRGVRVVTAETGTDAIALLERDPEIDAVLMDIMMPEMDGYETMRRIRQNPRHRLLPIVALTAKAMRGDREKCLEAGASDYIAKPVDADELLALLRIWLHGRPRSPRYAHDERADSAYSRS